MKAAKVALARAKADEAQSRAARAKVKAIEDAMNLYQEARKQNLDAKEGILFETLRQLQSEGGTVCVRPPELKKLQDQRQSPSQDDTE